MLQKIFRPLLLMLSMMSSCLEPYAPPDLGRTVNFLVVDAFLNSTDGSLNVRLTRANPLNSTEPFRTEDFAQVSLVSEAGATFPVPSVGQGNYWIEGVAINLDQQYKLTIRTQNGRDYESGLVNVVQTPPIDSITWRPDADGVSILVNTHDDTNSTRYYQWRYVETWQYNAPQSSSYKFETGFVFLRQPDELIYTCYSTQPSTDIRVWSSNRLSSDVIRDFRVAFIPKGSPKISQRYSILVQQNALSREAFEFWQQLQQTSQDIGGLFDPQPGKVIGNLRCLTDPTEPVLGIFSAGSVAEERIFLNVLELPPHLREFSFNEACRPDSLRIQDIQFFNPQVYLIVNAIYDGLTVVGYTYTTHPCADCRYQGGVLTKPDYWP